MLVVVMESVSCMAATSLGARACSGQTMVRLGSPFARFITDSAADEAVGASLVCSGSCWGTP